MLETLPTTLKVRGCWICSESQETGQARVVTCGVLEAVCERNEGTTSPSAWDAELFLAWLLQRHKYKLQWP